MSDRSRARLARELKQLQTSPEESMKVELYDPRLHGGGYGQGNDLYLWHASLRGPTDTPFEGGTYPILLRIPKEYPMNPPTALFLVKVFHPNVQFEDGGICLDILKSQWSPAWTMRTVCIAVLVLLSEPEHSSPLNCDAAKLLREGDTMGYHSMGRFYASTCAGAPEMTWEE